MTTLTGTDALEDLRSGLMELFGAERRLKSREQGPGSLTYSQLRALSAFANGAEELPAGDLARAADLQPASVTGMLDQLEAKGIIERRRGDLDRRVCMVSLTPGGRRLLDVRRERWLAAWERRFGELPVDELATANRVLRQMADLLDSL